MSSRRRSGAGVRSTSWTGTTDRHQWASSARLRSRRRACTGRQRYRPSCPNEATHPRSKLTLPSVRRVQRRVVDERALHARPFGTRCSDSADTNCGEPAAPTNCAHHPICPTRRTAAVNRSARETCGRRMWSSSCAMGRDEMVEIVEVVVDGDAGEVAVGLVTELAGEFGCWSSVVSAFTHDSTSPGSAWSPLWSGRACR